MESNNFILLALAIILTVISALAVFNEQFFAYMRRTFWKPRKFDEDILSPEGVKRYTRFQAFMGLIVGIFLIVMWLLSR